MLIDDNQKNNNKAILITTTLVKSLRFILVLLPNFPNINKLINKKRFVRQS